MRKNIVAGNWKMNKNLQEGVALAKELKERVQNPNCEVIIGTPFIHLATVSELLKGSVIKVAAENCANHTSGAYTGEVSAEMVASTGATYCIIGHSERRQYFNEDDDIINKKLKKVVEHDLIPILCCGETLEQREEGVTLDFIRKQINNAFKNIPSEKAINCVIAYEPIWAIGTGKTATKEDANNSIKAIRNKIAEIYS